MELNTTDEILEELAFLADRMRKHYKIDTAKAKISDNHLRGMVVKFRAWESECFQKDEDDMAELWKKQGIV